MYASPIRTAPLIRTGAFGEREPIKLANGSWSDPSHRGVDMRAAMGTPVFPTIGGEVVQTITGYVNGSRPGTSRGRRIIAPGGAGNVVVIRGDDGRDHVYGHLLEVLVGVGQRVGTGTRVARSGTSGVYAAHLHYGLWIEYAQNRWRAIDPTLMLPWEGDALDRFEYIKDGGSSAPTKEDPVAPDGFDYKDRYLLGLVAASQGRVEAAVVGQSGDLAKLTAAIEDLRDPLAPVEPSE